MGMNETPSGERVHIAFFGRRNAGKSSLVNAVTGQSSRTASYPRKQGRAADRWLYFAAQYQTQHSAQDQS